MKRVKKAVIPAAGLGTRFLPATKAMPKEMLPIVDKPTIQYIIEEAIESGIEDILIITGKGKRAIEDHFDSVPELEANLIAKNKSELLHLVEATTNINIHFIRQSKPKGLGDAILQAKAFIGNEPFVVMLGDDIVQADVPCTRQLIEQYEITNSSIIGVQPVADKDTHRYGIVDPSTSISENLHKVKSFVEKPAFGTAPSNLAILGRYLLTPEIFKYLETQNIGSGGEVQLTDAITRLNEKEPVLVYEFDGIRHDIGEKLGFIETTIRFAVQRDDLREEVLSMLKTILEENLKEV
ncbi:MULTISPECIES: UTP--glucose-1-phosphate uridylyltransferase GalU [unclassified Exiguobacterium]|uniref:UTP--glucose-1-phosphate uridylyltransferase GalU n=1 Tax=unclassified Exiguobacterium TaxID=2644629 RepID=UPI001BE95ABD|nr:MULTISPECIES: UTP--glucose-1-phosphate uridylyltransferase GalU [unclassified Exiguobacterium]